MENQALARLSVRPGHAVCIATGGDDDLQISKLYRVLSDRAAAASGMVRVIDDSGEDYLYPADRFLAVALPAFVRRKLSAALKAL